MRSLVQHSAHDGCLANSGASARPHDHTCVVTIAGR